MLAFSNAEEHKAEKRALAVASKATLRLTPLNGELDIDGESLKYRSSCFRSSFFSLDLCRRPDAINKILTDLAPLMKPPTAVIESIKNAGYGVVKPAAEHHSEKRELEDPASNPRPLKLQKVRPLLSPPYIFSDLADF